MRRTAVILSAAALAASIAASAPSAQARPTGGHSGAGEIGGFANGYCLSINSNFKPKVTRLFVNNCNRPGYLTGWIVTIFTSAGVGVIELAHKPQYCVGSAGTGISNGQAAVLVPCNDLGDRSVLAFTETVLFGNRWLIKNGGGTVLTAAKKGNKGGHTCTWNQEKAGQSQLWAFPKLDSVTVTARS